MNVMLHNFETGEIIDGYSKFLLSFPEYAEYAQELSNDAESYRDLEVAAILVGMLPGEAGLQTITGTNWTPDHANAKRPNGGLNDEDLKQFDLDRAATLFMAAEVEDIDMLGTGPELHNDHPIPTRAGKSCAETDTLMHADIYEQEYAEEHGGLASNLFAAGFDIAGTIDQEDIAGIYDGKTAQTLPPCLPCTNALDASRFTSRATMYVSTGLAPGDPFQVRNIRYLRDFHNRGIDYTHEQPSILSPKVGRLAVDMFRSDIRNTQLPERLPSRLISSIARHALLEAGRSS
jgi:hypothetical protein